MTRKLQKQSAPRVLLSRQKRVEQQDRKPDERKETGAQNEHKHEFRASKDSQKHICSVLGLLLRRKRWWLLNLLLR